MHSTTLSLCSDPRRRHSTPSRFRRAATLALGLAGVLAGALSATQPQPGTASFCSTSVLEPYASQTGLPSSLRVAAEGETLEVEIPWTGAAATAVLTVATGEETQADGETAVGEELWLDLVPGFTEAVAFPSALAGRRAGETLIVRLAEVDDGTRDTAPFPTQELRARIAVDCPKSGCVYRLDAIADGALDTHAVVTSPALLDALRAAGDSDDLLGTVRARHPELARELPGLVQQLGDTFTSPDGALPTACQCAWFTSIGIDPTGEAIPTATGGTPQPMVSEVSGFIGPGASFLVGAQSRHGIIEFAPQDPQQPPGTLAVIASTTVDVELVCATTTASHSRTVATTWNTQPELTVEEPRLLGCDIPCQTSISVNGHLYACAETMARSGDGELASASSQIHTEMRVTNGQLGSQAPLQATAASDAVGPIGAWDTAQHGNQQNQNRLLFGPRASITLDGRVDLQAFAPPIPIADDYAFAGAAMEYVTSWETSSVCPEVPTTTGLAFKLLKDVNGGVSVYRWEDPK